MCRHVLYALYIGVRALCKTYSARATHKRALSLYTEARARALSLYIYRVCALYRRARPLSTYVVRACYIYRGARALSLYIGARALSLCVERARYTQARARSLFT